MARRPALGLRRAHRLACALIETGHAARGEGASPLTQDVRAELSSKGAGLWERPRTTAGPSRASDAGNPTVCCGDMTLQRMDNVLIVVEDMEAVKAFFAELGMELEGETTVEGPWVDGTIGLTDVRADIAMMRVPGGPGRVELTKFHAPPAVRAKPENAPANTLGIRRIMFAVDDIDDVVARLRSHGAELLGEIAQYEDVYRLCFMRGPEGIIIGLAEQLR